jgi:Fe-S cluster assembly protein SufD
MSTEALGQLESWLPPPDARQLPPGRPSWLEVEREEAVAHARKLGLPTTKQENWRYTGLKGLLEQGFLPHARPAGLRHGQILSHLIPGLDSHRVVLVNGQFVPELSDALDGLPPGVRIGSLHRVLEDDPDAVRDRLARIATIDKHLFAALNTAALQDGLVVLLDAEARLERPVELIHVSTSPSATAHVAQPRHLIALERGADATLIERFVGSDDVSYCTNVVAEVSLAEHARLEHYRIQTEGRSAYHIASLHVAQDGDSRYRVVNVGMGGAWARTDLVARFASEGAECELSGLYLCGDQQLIDYHLDVDHAVPGCMSREHFKGILHGKGRAVFDGYVHVARDAQRSDAQMVNKNLLLSANAEIDAKPQLKIYADDVKCSHGTTVGQIEPDSLFYLRSRGIPVNEARRMLCMAFAEEVLGGLRSVPSLHEHVSELVGATLEAVRFD